MRWMDDKMEVSEIELIDGSAKFEKHPGWNESGSSKDRR
jgi:hypothetical protein